MWVTQSCICSNPDINLPISKYCGGNGAWENTHDGQCRSSASICATTSEELLDNIDDIAKNVTSSDDAGVVVSVLDSLANKVDNTTQETFFDAVDTVLDTDEMTLQNATENQPFATQLVDALEKVGSNLGGSANILRDNFQVISMRVDPDTVVEDVEVETKDAIVDIPPVVIKQMGGGSPATVSVFEIRAPAVFGRVDPVSSPIVGINLGSIRDLLSPIQIHFSNVRTPNRGMQNRCGFWDSNQNGGIGGWSDRGLTTRLRNNGRVSCATNHLTAFGIYQVPEEQATTEAPTGLPVGAIAGIAAGGAVAVLVICIVLFVFICYMMRRRKRIGRYSFGMTDKNVEEEAETVENEYVTSGF